MADPKKEDSREVAQMPAISQSLLERLAGSVGKAAMTFDPTTPAGARKFLMARLKDLPPIKERINLEIHITDFFTHDVSRIGDETAEIEEWQRTVIYDKNGEAYTCGSKGVWESLVALTMVRPQVPWNPPITVTVKTREIGNGKLWMWLDPDFESLFANVQQPKRK